MCRCQTAEELAESNILDSRTVMVATQSETSNRNPRPTCSRTVLPGRQGQILKNSERIWPPSERMTGPVSRRIISRTAQFPVLHETTNRVAAKDPAVVVVSGVPKTILEKFAPKSEEVRRTLTTALSSDTLMNRR